MAKLNKVYKVNTRDQVACLTQLVGTQKRKLIDILEGIKPAVLTEAVACDGDNFSDIGVYFQVEKDRKYCLKVECSFADADLDGTVELSIGPIANLEQFDSFGFSFNSGGSVSVADEENNYEALLQGIAWVPATEQAVVQGYGTMYFQVDEPTILSLQYKAGSGDTTMLAASNFTLTEIEIND